MFFKFPKKDDPAEMSLQSTLSAPLYCEYSVPKESEGGWRKKKNPGLSDCQKK